MTGLHLTPERIARALRDHDPSSIPRAVAPRRAAVAALLRFADEGASVLLMKRVDRAGDRWSGHISFPGGMAEPEDADLVATAVRETREEVGVDLLASARLLGRLDDQVAIAKGRVLPMAITPFVFEQTGPLTFDLGPEAAAVLWLPLERGRAGALDDQLDYRMGPVPVRLPCWRHEGYTIWGLTYQMLKRFLQVVR